MLRSTKQRPSRKQVRRSPRIVRIPSEYFDAMDIGSILFPPLYQLENGLRFLLNSYLTTCYGSDWWEASLKAKRHTIFEYAELQQKKLDAMPWIGSSSAIAVLP